MKLDERRLWVIEDLEDCKSLDIFHVRLEEIEVRRPSHSNSITF